jgi:hypothetical protein
MVAESKKRKRPEVSPNHLRPNPPFLGVAHVDIIFAIRG